MRTNRIKKKKGTVAFNVEDEMFSITMPKWTNISDMGVIFNLEEKNVKGLGSPELLAPHCLGSLFYNIGLFRKNDRYTSVTKIRHPFEDRSKIDTGDIKSIKTILQVFRWKTGDSKSLFALMSTLYTSTIQDISHLIGIDKIYINEFLESFSFDNFLILNDSGVNVKLMKFINDNSTEDEIYNLINIEKYNTLSKFISKFNGIVDNLDDIPFIDNEFKKLKLINQNFLPNIINSYIDGNSFYDHIDDYINKVTFLRKGLLAYPALKLNLTNALQVLMTFTKRLYKNKLSGFDSLAMLLRRNKRIQKTLETHCNISENDLKNIKHFKDLEYLIYGTMDIKKQDGNISTIHFNLLKNLAHSMGIDSFAMREKRCYETESDPEMTSLQLLKLRYKGSTNHNGNCVLDNYYETEFIVDETSSIKIAKIKKSLKKMFSHRNASWQFTVETSKEIVQYQNMSGIARCLDGHRICLIYTDTSKFYKEITDNKNKKGFIEKLILPCEIFDAKDISGNSFTKYNVPFIAKRPI